MRGFHANTLQDKTYMIYKNDDRKHIFFFNLKLYILYIVNNVSCDQKTSIYCFSRLFLQLLKMKLFILQFLFTKINIQMLGLQKFRINIKLY